MNTIEYSVERDGEDLTFDVGYDYTPGTPGRTNCAMEDSIPPTDFQIKLYDVPVELTTWERMQLEEIIIATEEDV